MLNLIDRLPRNTYYAEAVAADPEHMRLLVDAGAGREKDTAPPMSSWSAEVEALTRVHDAIKVLIAITIMANSKKGAAKPDTTPSPRPGTVLSEIERERKREKHRKLVALLLPERGEEAAE